jgi:hypothetical protein
VRLKAIRIAGVIDEDEANPGTHGVSVNSRAVSADSPERTWLSRQRIGDGGANEYALWYASPQQGTRLAAGGSEGSVKAQPSVEVKSA